LNKGLSLGEPTAIAVVTEAFLIVTLIGEHVILKEKELVWVKATAVVFATAGAIIMQVAH
jgi:hypothetical protein